MELFEKAKQPPQGTAGNEVRTEQILTFSDELKGLKPDLSRPGSLRQVQVFDKSTGRYVTKIITDLRR